MDSNPIIRFLGAPYGSEAPTGTSSALSAPAQSAPLPAWVSGARVLLDAQTPLPKRPRLGSAEGCYQGYPSTPHDKVLGSRSSQLGTNTSAQVIERRKAYGQLYPITSTQQAELVLKFLKLPTTCSLLEASSFQKDSFTGDVEKQLVGTGKQASAFLITDSSGTQHVYRVVGIDDFKKDTKQASTILPQWALQGLGRDPVHPLAIQRKWTAHQLDESLGLRLLPRLQGVLSTQTSFGSVEAYVKGQSLAHFCNQEGIVERLSGNPQVLEQLTLLQIFDALIGELDRHSSNILVQETSEGKLDIKGIDTDQCLPEEIAAYNQQLIHGLSKAKKNPENPETMIACYVCRWPTIMTQQLIDYVEERLACNSVAEALNAAVESGLCTESQKACVLQNLSELQSYLGLDGTPRSSELKIIEAHEWFSEQARSHFTAARRQHWSQENVNRNFSYLTKILEAVTQKEAITTTASCQAGSSNASGGRSL